MKKPLYINHRSIDSLEDLRDLLKDSNMALDSSLKDELIRCIVDDRIERKLREFGNGDLADNVHHIDQSKTDSKLIEDLIRIVCNTESTLDINPFDYIEVVGSPSILHYNSWEYALLKVRIKKTGVEDIKIRIIYSSSEESKTLRIGSHKLNDKVDVKSDLFQDPSEKVMFQIGDRTYTATRSSKDLPFTANGVNFNMIFVEKGSFRMGSDQDSDNPIHPVELTQNFYIGETVVTQALWRAVMNNNPSIFKGDDLPVENVAYYDPNNLLYSAKVFIDRLNNLLQNKLPQGYHFDLPTEAQWEYAARGGAKHEGYEYSGSKNLAEVAWYNKNSKSTTHPVKEEKKPNGLYIYGMSGNVWEWCRDWYNGTYCNTSARDPVGPPSGSGRVLRGGSWYDGAGYCRVASRYFSSPDFRYSYYGFRLSLVHQ